MDIKNTLEYRQLRARAIRRAYRAGCVLYVVLEGQELDIATDEDLLTFYAGTPDECILFCTADGV